MLRFSFFLLDNENRLMGTDATYQQPFLERGGNRPLEGGGDGDSVGGREGFVGVVDLAADCDDDDSPLLGNDRLRSFVIGTCDTLRRFGGFSPASS